MGLSNYPYGAEFDPRAPYNQPAPREHEFDVEVTATLMCDTTIVSYDAIEIFCEDEDGYSAYIDKSNVNISEDFYNQKKSPKDLIKYLYNILLEHPEIEFSDRKIVLESCGMWLGGNEEIEAEEC